MSDATTVAKQDVQIGALIEKAKTIRGALKVKKTEIIQRLQSMDPPQELVIDGHRFELVVPKTKFMSDIPAVKKTVTELRTYLAKTKSHEVNVDEFQSHLASIPAKKNKNDKKTTPPRLKITTT